MKYEQAKGHKTGEIDPAKTVDDELLKRMRNKHGTLIVLADMLNETISVVKSTLNLLESNPADEKLVKHGLKTAKLAHSRAEYYAKCISELIAVKKIPVKKERLLLNEVLCKTACEFAAKLQKAKIGFEADIPQEQFFIDADTAELDRIFENMLHISIVLLLPGEKVFLFLLENRQKSDVSIVFQFVNSHHQIKIVPIVSLKNFPELKFDMMKQIMESHEGSFEIREDDFGVNPQYIFRFPQKAVKKK